MKTDELSALLDQYVALADSPRNRSLLTESWLDPNLAYIDDVGIPRPGMVPVVASPFQSMWARKMGISVKEMYLDPYTYLTVWLSRETGRFTEIQDDRPLNRRVWVLMGAGFEASLFGSQQVYVLDQDPLVDRTPILQQPNDLNRLQLPDFHESGLMPLAHRMYNEMSELTQDYGLEIRFPDWERSPFATAHRLRGEEQFLVDMLERPDFVGMLLDFLTRSAIHYRTERARFLGVRLDKPQFSNDEVNVPSLSPRLYRDLVLPQEKAYAAAFGGLMYWHSCGNVTPMLPAIREIPDITIFNVGPWTDVRTAAEVFGDVTLDICMHPLDAFQDEQAIHSKVVSIVKTCWRHGARSLSLRAGAFLALDSPERQVVAGRRWVQAAKQAVGRLLSTERPARWEDDGEARPT